jgi:hypothetical protein
MTPNVIEAIEASAEGAPSDLASAIRERIPHLKRLAANPVQHVFDLIMSARTPDDLRRALQQLQLLGDSRFLAEMRRLSGQIGDPDAAARLNHALSILEG